MPRRLLIFCLFFCLAASIASAQTDESPPVATSAQVNGNILTITCNEPLDEDSVPPATSFQVMRIRPSVTDIYDIEGVSIEGSTVTLTLSGTVAAGVTGLTVSYVVPITGQILQDRAGNQAAAFSSLAVANNSPEGTTGTAPADPPPSPGSAGDYIDDMVEACRTFINAAEERDR